jgi:tetratricopeptide (TPR) repeat protein
MMLDESGLPLEIPDAAKHALTAAGAAWENEATAETHIRTALAAAPEALAVRMGAYKFYLYRHRLEDALPHAHAVLELAARRLQLPHDWRDVAAHHAAFDRIEPWPRLFLQALIAIGYAHLRLGRTGEGRLALAKAIELDPHDRFGAARLLAVAERGGRDEEDED